MTTFDADAESDHAIARRIAIEAAELLVEVRKEFEPLDELDKFQRLALGDAGDIRANDLILQRLAQARPDDAVLSEEVLDDRARVVRDRVWIIDPLDGTSEFRNGRDEFAVHVALWNRGEGLTAASISLPDRGRTWFTGDAPTTPTPLDLEGPIRLVISRSHVPVGTETIIERLTQSLRDAGHHNAEVSTYSVGSVGAKVDELLIDNAAAYIFTGGLSEWDTAAPFAVAEHRGFIARDVNNDPFEYNRERPVVPSGFVAHPTIAELLAVAVAGSGL